MNYILEHAGELFAILTSVIGTASLIAALTPTPKDDGVLKKIKSLLDILGANVFNAKNKK